MTLKKIQEIKNDITKKFSGIVLNEKTHVYDINGKTDFQSVTTFLGEFSTPFNAHMMSTIMARVYNKKNPIKLKRDANWYKRYWKAKGDEASSRGHRVHQYAESYPDIPDPSCIQESGVCLWYESLDKDTYEILFMELRMYDVKTKKAGTADLILLNKKTGKLVIVDWKTNHASLLQCYKKKRLKAPFNDMYDTKLNKYKLQLSQYKQMLETNTKYKVEEMWVVWLKSGDYKAVDPEKNAANYEIVHHEPSCITETYVQFNIESYSDLLKNILFNNDRSPKPLFGSRKKKKVKTPKEKFLASKTVGKRSNLKSKIKKDIASKRKAIEVLRNQIKSLNEQV